MNKNIIIGIAVLVLIAGGVLFYMSGNNNLENNNGTTNNDVLDNGSNQINDQSGVESSAKGSVFFSITDAAVDMGEISSITMTVDKVEMKSETRGWVTISESPKTFDLLKLKAENKTELLAEENVVATTYNQIRLRISRIVVTERGQAKEAKLPSNELKINGDVKVGSSTESSVKLDVLASESLHKTGKGEFIFAPVLKFESRSGADVKIGSDNSVTILGGSADDNATVGMDVNGEVKENFRLEINANLELDGGVIKLDGKSKAKVDLGI